MLIDLIITLYFYLLIIILLLADSIISIPLKLFSFKSNLVHYLLIISGKLLLFISGCRVKVENLFKNLGDDNYLIISNHQSMFDIFVLNYLLGYRDYRWIVKSNLFSLPFLGLLMSLAGYISINRRNKYKAYRAIQKAIAILNHKASIIIFPEGTRSTRDEILPFKRGSIKIAFSTKKDILPIVLKNTLYVKRRGSFLIRPKLIKAKILNSLETKIIAPVEQQRILYLLHKKISQTYKGM